MTPEERAKAIANKISFEAGAHHTSWFCATAKEWIATAIREAVAEKEEEIHLLRINLAEARQQIAQAKVALRDKTA